MKSVCLISLLLIAGGCSGSGSGPATYTTPPAATYSLHTFDFATDDTADTAKIDGAQVSAGFFGATGAQPMLGRTTTPADFVVGSVRPIAILSYDLWAQRFGSDQTILSRSIMLDGKLTVIVGVMPKGFSVPSGALVWTPR
jgi:hypothetical protein